MATKEIKKVVQQFKEALQEASFPKVRMLIFGSQARGDARPDSDIDLCLVSPEFKKKKEQYRKKAVFIAYYIDPRIQLVLVDPEKLKKDKLSPLFCSIRKEAAAI